VDYKMPGLDGFEVIRRARDLHPTLKIVLITGHGNQEVMGQAHQKNLNGILIKPFTPDELGETVANVLASGKSG